MHRGNLPNAGCQTYPAQPLVISNPETMTATCCYVVPVVGERLELVLRAAVRGNDDLAISSFYPDEARIVRRSFGQYGYVWIGLEFSATDSNTTVIAARSKSTIDLSGGVGQLTALMHSIRTETSHATA